MLSGRRSRRTTFALNTSLRVSADGCRCITKTSCEANTLKVSAGFTIFTHLIKEKLSPLLFPEVHLLHGHLLAAVLLAGDAHDASGAFADFNEAVQVFPRVAWRVRIRKTKHGALTQHRTPGQEVVLLFWFLTRVDDQLERSSELLVGDSGGLGVGAGAPRRRRVGTRGDVG